MPHKDKEARRLYMREYKHRNHEKLNARRRELYQNSHERPDFWSAGHSDKRICLNCGGLADKKPLDICKDERHMKNFKSRLKCNNEYRKRKRREARETGEVYRKGRGSLQNRRNYQMRRIKQMRSEIMDRLNQHACVLCGFTDIRALQFDHRNGDGAEHRRQAGSGVKYLRSILATSDHRLRTRFQVLCANCNIIKREENNECYTKTNPA